MICLKEDWRHTVKFTLKEILKRYIGEIVKVTYCEKHTFPGTYLEQRHCFVYNYWKTMTVCRRFRRHFGKHFRLFIQIDYFINSLFQH